PEVEELTSTAQLAARIRTLVDVGGQALVLHEEAERGLAHCVAAAPREVLLIVGPEGGVSPEEIERLVAAGAQPVRLGAEVLRTSTAGAAAVAAILSHTPRWDPERG
ncbi:MAG: RsmE family RNA methyltransferase, partial [Nocardioides sp.]